MTLSYGSIAIIAILLGTLLWLFKSRLTLIFALRQEKATVGSIYVRVVKVPASSSLELSAFVDSLSGWAGRITAKRDGSGSFIVECRRGRHRSGPPDNDALYIDGKKLKANTSRTVGPDAVLILRQMAMTPNVVQIRLT